MKYPPKKGRLKKNKKKMAEFEEAEPIIKKIKIHAASINEAPSRENYLRQVVDTAKKMHSMASCALKDMEQFERAQKDNARSAAFMAAFPNDFIMKSLVRAGITVRVTTAPPRQLEIYRAHYGNMEGLSVGRPTLELLMIEFATEDKTVEVGLRKTMNRETAVAIRHKTYVHEEREAWNSGTKSLTNIGSNPEEFLKILDHIPHLRGIAEDFKTFLIFCYRIATYKIPVLKDDGLSYTHHLDAVFNMIVVDCEKKCFRDSGLLDPYFYLNE